MQEPLGTNLKTNTSNLTYKTQQRQEDLAAKFAENVFSSDHHNGLNSGDVFSSSINNTDLSDSMANLASLDPLKADSDPFGLNQLNKMFTNLLSGVNVGPNLSNSVGPSMTYSVGQNMASGKVNQATNLGIPLGGGNLKTVKSASGAKFSVNEKVASQFQAFINELESMGYKIDSQTSGGFNFRKIAGKDKFSQHAYGNAIDINWGANGLGKGKGNLPDNISEIAAKYGLTWGGDFKSNNDPMHFEVAKLMPNIDTNVAIG